jgi:hypothetical protein
MAEYAPIIQSALHLITPFLFGAALGMLGIGRVLQRVDNVAKAQDKTEVKNDAAHEKLFTGLDSLRKDVNGNISKLNTGLTRVGTTVDTLPCRPAGHRPPDDCPGG